MDGTRCEKEKIMILKIADESNRSKSMIFGLFSYLARQIDSITTGSPLLIFLIMIFSDIEPPSTSFFYELMGLIWKGILEENGDPLAVRSWFAFEFELFHAVKNDQVIN